MSNHLGNVMAVIGDHLTIVNDTTRYPSVFSLNDYYVFGAAKRWSGSEGYRYGFNGKENDNELKGEGNQQDYGMRIYDPRLGKFLSVDPLTNQYPMLTPYQFASNTPIWAGDLDGAEGNPYYLMPNTSVLTNGFKKAVKFAGEVAEGVVETAFMAIGALTEMPARMHYEKKIAAENVSTTFPLTGNQNLLDVGKGAVMAPIMTAQKILEDPGDGKNWGEGLVVAFGSSKVLSRLWVEKVPNTNKSFIGETTGPIAINAKGPVVGGGATATKGVIRSFDDVVTHPKALWGKSADEVGSMLGEGWTKGAYGSSKTGWKFTRGTDGQSIFYHPGGGRHGGSYYGFSSGTLGKTKIVGTDYIPLKGDKATIINIGN